ncbi:60S ribosomal protein L13A (nucleomorph) [Lotharella oceanica]|uniref:60S ribosomal protein L13A n=1 Tax=Lotharella oceanica TaxID=641309 RepID=A0A060D766_9EUKA|nr:60S ribosomal protein L13A [Lotharella oceanica]
MKYIVINGENLIYGRIASKIVKLLKDGYFIRIINCQNLVISGRKQHTINRFVSKFNKKTRTNPNKGPFKFNSPVDIFLKSIKGMISQKKKTFMSIYKRLQCFNGQPSKYKLQKNFIFYKFNKSIRLKNISKWIYLKDVAKKLGWESEISFVVDLKKKTIPLLNFKSNFRNLSFLKNNLNKLK